MKILFKYIYFFLSITYFILIFLHFTEAYVNLGVTLTSVGRKTEAADILRTAATVNGVGLKDKRVHEAARIQALLRLGALYADEGQLHEALSSYREALQTLPEYYPPQVILFQV